MFGVGVLLLLQRRRYTLLLFGLDPIAYHVTAEPTFVGDDVDEIGFS
jgi:hypothetical protein